MVIVVLVILHTPLHSSTTDSTYFYMVKAYRTIVITIMFSILGLSNLYFEAEEVFFLYYMAVFCVLIVSPAAERQKMNDTSSIQRIRKQPVRNV